MTTPTQSAAGAAAADDRPDDWHEVVEVEHSICKKVRRTGETREAFLKKAIREADLTLGDQRKAFLERARRMLREMIQLLRAGTGADEARLAIQIRLEELGATAGTFRLPLASDTALALHEFLTKRPVWDAVGQEIVRLHLSSIQLVLEQDLQGDGGMAGTTLRVNLRKAVQKVLDRKGLH